MPLFSLARLTNGCTVSTGSLLTTPPRFPFLEYSACSTPEWTTSSVSKYARKEGDSRLYVSTWETYAVSPPEEGESNSQSVVNPGGCFSYVTYKSNQNQP